jgi:hypothetical protein
VIAAIGYRGKDQEGKGMSPEPTQATAQKRLYRQLVRTLRSLPAGAALSLAHPDLRQAHLHSGVSLPVDDSADEVDSEFFDIAYWVIGATPCVASEYFDLIVRSWIQSGWPTRTDRDSRPRAAYTRAPDGVGLSVRESVNGYVSLSGSTPPFAVGSPSGPPFPESIDHPLTAPDRSGSPVDARDGDEIRAHRSR